MLDLIERIRTIRAAIDYRLYPPQHNFGSAYEIVLHDEADLSEKKVYHKCAIFYFYILSTKLISILDDVLNTQGEKLDNVSDELNDWHEALLLACDKLTRRKDFEELGIANILRPKELYGDMKEMKEMWAIDRPFFVKQLQQLNVQYYEIPNDIKLAFQEIEKVMADTVKYWVEFKFGGEIIVNDTYILKTLQYGGDNDLFFEYVVKHPRKEITTTEFEVNNMRVFKEYSKLIFELGFGKELGKIFFPRVSKTSVYFQNNIRKSELHAMAIDYKALTEELSHLKKFK